MNYIDFEHIVYNSNRDDWLYNDYRGIFTYKHDLNLRIHRLETDHDCDAFGGEDWATNHPDKNAFKITYELHYCNSFVKEEFLVSVDGNRATLPMPKIGTNEVPERSYKFAKIVDTHGSLDEYMARSKLIIL